MPYAVAKHVRIKLQKLEYLHIERVTTKQKKENSLKILEDNADITSLETVKRLSLQLGF